MYNFDLSKSDILLREEIISIMNGGASKLGMENRTIKEFFRSE
jgi:hypothetical protein